MNKKITIIMPHLNEDSEPADTIKSIYDTANPELFNIIAVDDASDKTRCIIPNRPEIISFRGDKRKGVDFRRHQCVLMSETPYVFIIDAHMRFKNDNWLEKIIESLGREPNTAWCTTCLGLGYGNMDINKAKGKYYGADLLIVDKNANPSRPVRECLEPKWASYKNALEYEIPCILGANYGFSKEWFLYLKGLDQMRSWGSSETLLSLKSWLAGGKCKIRTDIEIGHKFRDNAPYVTNISDLIWNKIYIAKTMLPEDLGNKILDCIPKNINYKVAMDLLSQNSEVIAEHKSYYSDIFKLSIYDYCKKFGIELP